MSGKGTTKRCALVDRELCVACGACRKVCPKGAISVYRGCFAAVSSDGCVGCGLCAKVCPGNAISIIDREVKS